MQRILIYRSELLAYSETFIAAQAAAMRTYAPFFAGLRRVQRSLPLPAPSCVLTEGDSFRERLRRLTFSQTGYAPALFNAVRQRSPVLVHAHFALDAAQALPLVRSLDLPLVVTLHGYDVMARDEVHRQTRAGRLYLARRQQLFARASLFLCVSDAIRRKAIERGYPPARLRVHTIGIDLTQFTPPTELLQAPSILFVGRLVEKKGCVHLIRAMHQVRQSLPHARLVVIGDGPERLRLEAEARQWAPETIFLGAQNAEQVRQWMLASRVMAAPSIEARSGDAEGLPIVLCEALAMGLPVTSFRSSGIPELVRHEVEGLLAEEGDEAALARNLLRLCEDDVLAQRLGKAGRRRVEERFELAAQTAELEAIYGEVLGTSGRARRAMGRGAPGPVLLKTAAPFAGEFPGSIPGALPGAANGTIARGNRSGRGGGVGALGRGGRGTRGPGLAGAGMGQAGDRALTGSGIRSLRPAEPPVRADGVATWMRERAAERLKRRTEGPAETGKGGLV